MQHSILFFVLLILLTSCKKTFQFSLLEARPNARDLNIAGIEKINQLSVKDTFTFAVISDTQVGYDELEGFVKHINQFPDDSLTFVLHAGDFTDYGANFEFNAYEEVIRDLKFPVVGVIGNHDMLGNGTYIYQKMFGPENFTFTYGKNIFIFQNSNARETAFDGKTPDLDWLTQTVKEIPLSNNVFYVAHVPPFSLDFDKSLEMDYVGIQSSIPNSRLGIYGHHHNYALSDYYDNGMEYLIAPTILHEYYILVRVEGNTISTSLKGF